MTIGKLECFAGISGDMMLGALIDAGVSAESLRVTAEGLGIGASLRIYSADRSGIRATKVDVLEHGRPADGDHRHEHEHGHHHGHSHHEHDHRHDHEHEHGHQPAHRHVHGRNWPEIRSLIAASSIAEQAKAIALRAFELLAQAEAKIHGIAPEQVHFHEVGAVDAIVDIVCAAVGAASLGVTEWRCSAVNVGSGFVNCAHGQFPVPAPATAELLKGVPVYSAGPAVEMTTPTGAALLRALNCRLDAGEALEISSVGYGAGGRNPERFPNVLRLSVGRPVEQNVSKDAPFSADRVVVLECALDDATPQLMAHAMDLALEQGALDVMAAPVTMKKGRPGTLLTVLCKAADEAALQRLLFRETTTLGIRRREEERAILEREFVTVDTEFGQIRMKIGSAQGEVFNAMPEYEDCRRAAREHGVALRTAMEAARAAYGEALAAKVKG